MEAFTPGGRRQSRRHPPGVDPGMISVRRAGRRRGCAPRSAGDPGRSCPSRVAGTPGPRRPATPTAVSWEPPSIRSPRRAVVPSVRGSGSDQRKGRVGSAGSTGGGGEEKQGQQDAAHGVSRKRLRVDVVSVASLPTVGRSMCVIHAQTGRRPRDRPCGMDSSALVHAWTNRVNLQFRARRASPGTRSH